MNELIVSLPAEKLILKLDISGLTETTNIIPLAGNGQTCKGNGLCGDGDEAVKASLTYPKVQFSVSCWGISVTLESNYGAYSPV